jgi:hypothetical protein
MRKILLLLVLFSGSLSAVTMYRWFDDDGVVHYSDTPQPGAIAIEVSLAQGYEPSPLYKSAPSALADALRNDADIYNSLTIIAPTPDQVLWNVGGVVNVVLDVSPVLRTGDTVTLFYDGQNMSAPGSRRLSYVLNEVPRGTHTVRAVISNRSGGDILQSQMITFHVHQTSIK